MKIVIMKCFAIIFCSICLTQGLAIVEPKKIQIQMDNLPIDTETFYASAQTFFNSIFGNLVHLQISSEQIIRGEVTFQGSQEIPAGYSVYVSILDVSLADAPAINLAETVIQNPVKFPIVFSIPYSHPLNAWGHYILSVVIKENDQLRFISDTQVDITNGYDGQIAHHLAYLINVIQIGPIPVQSANPSSLTRRNTIKGSLVCMDIKCAAEHLDKQNLTISIQDVSLADAPSRTLVSKVISLNSGWKFPVNYEIEFDSTKVYADLWRTFSISARISDSNNGKLTFISDTRHRIIDGYSDSPEIFKNIDINIVVV